MTRKISQDFARAVNNYLLIEQTTLIPADFALVFGNAKIIEPLADRTANLYHTGHFPLVAVSGGVKTRNHLTEAEALRRAFIKRGIPDNIILTEKQAIHTGENVTLTRALLAAKGLERGLASVISIGHIIAARRFLMTLERHWPELHKMHASANPFNVPAQDWYTHEVFRRHAITEWQKIKPYLKQDIIREIDIDALERETTRIRTIRIHSP